MNHLGDTNKMVGEDHIRDATKMVSETPRTDKVTRIYGDASVEWEEELVPVDACRAIERELNAANQRIKRLEEAGNRLKDRYILENENWDLQTVNDWNDAKEDKP